METSSIINTIGLSIDIIGATLIFLNTQKVKFGTFLYSNEYLEKRKLKANKMNRNNGIGALLLVVGFILQLIATWV